MYLFIYNVNSKLNTFSVNSAVWLQDSLGNELLEAFQ